MKEFIIQAIGTVAYIILMWSYHKEKKSQILFMQIIATLTFAIHYYLLSGITGAVCSIIESVMMLIIYIFERKDKEKNKKVLIGIMIPILVIIALCTWKNIYSIFPIIAVAITLAGFLLDNENAIRIIGIVSAISWLVYGIIYLSYSAMIFEAITIITTIVAIIKSKKNKEVL